LDVALSEFEKATQVFPDYANAHNNLGVVLAKKGQFEKALTHFGEALRISPGEAKVLESVRNVERDRSQAVGSQMKDPEALQANREPSNSR